MIGAAYCSKDLCEALTRKGIEAHFSMKFEKGGSWYKRYTLDVAQRWLREVHQLNPEVYRTACGYIACIVKVPSGTDLKILEYSGDDAPSGQYTTHELALEAAIRYCVENLI
jgi:hypothetical protein